jgi:hypothetical protein
MAGADDLGLLANRAVAVAVRWATRAAWLAVLVTILTAVIVLTSFFLGVAAFDGGWETAWIVIGGTFAVIAILSPARAAWRMVSVRRHARSLVGEMKQLVSRDPAARRTVIETVEAGESSDERSVVVYTRDFGSMRTLVVRQTDLPELTRSVTAFATFPLLLLVAAVVTTVFAFLAMFFLIALAFD